MNLKILPLTIAHDLSLEDERTSRQARTASLLTEIARLIATNLSLHQLLPPLHALLAELLPADQISLIELKPPEQVLMFPISETWDTTAFEFLRALANQAAQSGELLYLAGSELESETLQSQDLPQAPANVRSVVAVPLFYEGDVGGAFIVESHHADQELTEADAQLIAAVAFQIALVLERDRALDEARRRMDQMAAFSAVTSTVNEWVDVEQLARRFLAVFLNTTFTNSGLFYLLESDEQFRLVAQFGIAGELLDAFRLGALSQHPDLQRTMGRGRLVILNEDEPAQIISSAHDLAMLIPAESMVLLPLRVKGRGIGIVMLGKSEGHIEIADREFVQGLADQAAQAIENARLFAESQRRFEEQSALRDLAQRFLSAISPDEVLERTLDSLMTLLPGDFYEVLLPDSEGTFALYNGRGWRRGVVGRTRTASDPHLHAGYVLRAQSPIIIENFVYETRFQPSDYLMRHQVVAGMCAPMLAETRVIGLLGVYSRTPRHFTEEQSHFLYLVATQTAIALEKARHSQSAARRLDELILLNDVIGAANSEVSLDDVLKRITGEIGELLRSDNVQVFFVEENGNGMQLRAALNAPSIAQSEWGRVAAHWVLRNRQPVMTQDLARDLRFNAQAYDVRACLAVPMMISVRVIGVIAVAHPEANTFDTNDLRLLTTLAGQVAAAIERARLLDETERQAESLATAFSDLEASYQATLLALSAALDARDRETEGHSQRVTRLAMAIGRRLKLSPDELTSLERGALLHDVGKIGISDNVLLKAGPLTADERALMNRHPQLGFEMLKAVPFLRDALPVVLHHQEMYDGSGYPDGLRGEEIPLGARIFAVADTYDAITSTRPYRRALSHEAALQEIVRCSGTQFDPMVVDAFISLFEK